MLIFIAAIIFLLIILFRKNITEYLENSAYIVGAGIFLLISFVIIHLGNKNSAKVSKQETENLIEEVVSEAINKTKEGLESSTSSIIEKTDTAVKEITDTTKYAIGQLNEQLNQVKQATATLKNLSENQNILVQAQFKIEHDPTGKAKSPFDNLYVFQLEEELRSGNYYELTLTSQESKNIFASTNNSFVTIIDSETINMNNVFYNSYRSWDNRANAPIQPISINYSLNMVSLDFLVEELKVGDQVEFLIEKRSDLIANYSQQRTDRTNNPSWFKGGFGHFVTLGNGKTSLPRTSINMEIKLRSGLLFECKTLSTTLANNNNNGGLYILAEVTKVHK